MRLLLNILWAVLGGLPMAMCWRLVGRLAALSIAGRSWAHPCFMIGQFALWPFGREMVDRQLVNGRHDLDTDMLGTQDNGNIVWFLVAGWWLACGHLTFALANFITVIGIPCSWQHLKLAMIAVAPFGKTVVVKP